MFSSGHRGGRGGRRNSADRRYYGFFRCGQCNASWESSHVYKELGTDTYYKQDCKKCNLGWAPYRVEHIKCRHCGEEECVCTEEERDERHVDPNKPHRSDLCHKCRSGRPCQGASY